MEISISYLLYFSSFSFCLAWAFISLQIQEFWLFGVHINDNIFASLFFTLTGLHFFLFFIFTSTPQMLKTKTLRIVSNTVLLLYISISYLLYFSSFSFCLAWAFISLQIQEF